MLEPTHKLFTLSIVTAWEGEVSCHVCGEENKGVWDAWRKL